MAKVGPAPFDYDSGPDVDREALTGLVPGPSRISVSAQRPKSQPPQQPQQPVTVKKEGIDVVDAQQLAAQMEAIHRKRGGATIPFVVVVVVISDLLVLGLIALVYFLLYTYAPASLVPNAGLAPVYLNDLDLGDISLNATTMSTSRTDQPLTLASAADLNLTSTAGQGIVLSASRLALGSELMVSGSTLSTASPSGSLSLVTGGTGAISLSAGSGIVITGGGPLSVSGALSVGGALTAATVSLSGSATVAGSVDLSGAVTVGGALSASALSATALTLGSGGLSSGGTLTAATLTSAQTLTVAAGGGALSVSGSTGISISSSGGAVSLSAPVSIGGAAVSAGDVLVVNGGLRIPSTASFPACSAAYRGMLQPTFGGSGVSDSLLVCAKNSSDVYAWQQVTYSALVSQFVTDLQVATCESIRTGDAVSYSGGALYRGAGVSASSNNAQMFATSGAVYSFATALSATQTVVVYTTSTQGFARLATYSSGSGSFSFGSAVSFDTTSIDRLTVAALSTTTFVLCYRDNTASTGKCAVGSVSGSSISMGAPAVFVVSPGNPDFTRVAALSSTRFVVVYSKFVTVNKYGAAIAGSVSGTSVAYGSEVIFNAAFTKEPYVGRLSSSTALVVFQATYGQAVVATLSGTTLSFGNVTTFSSISQDTLRVAVLSSSLFVIAWAGTAQKGTAAVGTVSGGTPLFTYASEFNSFGGIEQIELTPVSSSTLLIAYQSTMGNKMGSVLLAEVVGTTGLLYGPTALFASNVGAQSLAVAAPSTGATGFHLVWCDGGVGYITAGTMRGGTALLGVAQSDGGGGERVQVAVAGVVRGFTGLTPGTWYFAQSDGSVSSAYSTSPLGVAVSGTELLLTGMRVPAF